MPVTFRNLLALSLIFVFGHQIEASPDPTDGDPSVEVPEFGRLEHPNHDLALITIKYIYKNAVCPAKVPGTVQIKYQFTHKCDHEEDEFILWDWCELPINLPEGDEDGTWSQWLDIDHLDGYAACWICIKSKLTCVDDDGNKVDISPVDEHCELVFPWMNE